MRWAVLLVLALLAPGAVSAADMITGHAEVVDGDGLTVGPVRIRLHGIDAPELGQRCAESGGGTWQCDEAAANRLEDLIGGRAVMADSTCPFTLVTDIGSSAAARSTRGRWFAFMANASAWPRSNHTTDCFRYVRQSATVFSVKRRTGSCGRSCPRG